RHNESRRCHRFVKQLTSGVRPKQAGSAENEILRDTQIRRQREMLMYHPDAGVDGALHGVSRDSLAKKANLAGVRWQQAIGDAHQSAFSCAVLAQKGM